jgi:hypothetical protein
LTQPDRESFEELIEISLLLLHLIKTQYCAVRHSLTNCINCMEIATNIGIMYSHNAVFPSITSTSSLIKYFDAPSTSIRSDKTGTFLCNIILPLSSLPQASTSSTSSTAAAAAAAATTMEPSIYTVVIGKGKIPRQAQGNYYLKSLVRNRIEEYVNAKSKRIKSSIVTEIYNTICESCRLLQDEEKEEDESLSSPAYYSAFVRYDGKSYTPVTAESVPREKISSEFRDCLSDRYRSSSKNKVARRRLANKKEKESKRQQLQQLYEIQEEQEDQKMMISQQRLISSASSKISIGLANLSRIESFNGPLCRSFGPCDAFDSSIFEV